MKNAEELLAVYRDGLLNDTLPFWIKYSVDREFGGFTTALDRDGMVIDTDKGIWQQGRASWLFGELYNEVSPKSEWLELAKHGADFLERFGFDPVDGRMWFHVDQAGNAIRKRRYSFSESFAAIAFGELYKATGVEKYRDQAIQTFENFVTQNENADRRVPKFTNHRPTIGLGFPMITIVTAQELRDSIDFAEANRWIDESIEVIRSRHVRSDLGCVLETVGIDGEFIDHFEGRTLNPGHAIEGAWFIMKEGKHRNDRELIDLGLSMLDLSWNQGWDSDEGGILYFVDAKGLPVQEYWHDMKFWWPQNETIIATLLAYQLTDNPVYSQMHQQIHTWAYSKFPDQEFGEWFGYLHRDGRISSRVKGNLWKGPFHLPRMQLECWKLLDSMN